MNEIYLAVRNVRKRRFSFRLTSISIMIGLASVILISSVGESGREEILSTVEGIGMKGVMFTHTTGMLDGRSFDSEFCQTLKEDSMSKIEAMPFSLDYAEITLAEKPMSVLLWGVGENAEAYIDVSVLYGRMPSRDEINEALPVAVITDGIAEQVFGRKNAIGQELFIGKNGGETAYQIIGIIRTEAGTLNMVYADIPDFVYAPYTALAYYGGTKPGRMIAISDELNSNEIKRDVKSAIYAAYGSSFKLDVTDFNEGKAGVDRVAGLLTLILSFAASVSLIVAGIGIMSTMLQTVSERKREIGMMKALGATRFQIAQCFLYESIFVSLYGILFGLAVGLGGVFLLSRLTVLKFVLNKPVLGFAVLSSAISGVFFGAFPAIKAAGEDPIDALKND